MKRVPGVAPGAVGEFEISSRGLADGYWTREGFRRDAFLSHRDGARVRTWRMGDVGHALSGGGFVHLSGAGDSVVQGLRPSRQPRRDRARAARKRTRAARRGRRW